MDVLRYVRQNGCPWDEKTCSKAAENGNLHVLRYAIENGCPWDDEIYLRAANNKRIQLLQYIHEKIVLRSQEFGYW